MDGQVGWKQGSGRLLTTFGYNSLRGCGPGRLDESLYIEVRSGEMDLFLLANPLLQKGGISKMISYTFTLHVHVYLR